MKQRKKFYHPFPHDPHRYELQGTKTELVGILIIGIIAVVFLGYKYYVEVPDDLVRTKRFSHRTQEYHKAVKAWQDWHKKFNELNAQRLQAHDEMIEALPATKEEAKQYENDENYKREVERKYSEALARSAKIGAMLEAHESKKPHLPYIDKPPLPYIE